MKGAGVPPLAFSSAAIAPPKATWMYKPRSQYTEQTSILKSLRSIGGSSWNKRCVFVDDKNNFCYGKKDGDKEKVVPLISVIDASTLPESVLKREGAPSNLLGFGWSLVADTKEVMWTCENARDRDEWLNYLALVVRTNRMLRGKSPPRSPDKKPKIGFPAGPAPSASACFDQDAPEEDTSNIQADASLWSSLDKKRDSSEELRLKEERRRERKERKREEERLRLEREAAARDAQAAREALAREAEAAKEALAKEQAQNGTQNSSTSEPTDAASAAATAGLPDNAPGTPTQPHPQEASENKQEGANTLVAQAPQEDPHPQETSLSEKPQQVQPQTVEAQPQAQPPAQLQTQSQPPQPQAQPQMQEPQPQVQPPAQPQPPQPQPQPQAQPQAQPQPPQPQLQPQSQAQPQPQQAQLQQPQAQTQPQAQAQAQPQPPQTPQAQQQPQQQPQLQMQPQAQAKPQPQAPQPPNDGQPQALLQPQQAEQLPKTATPAAAAATPSAQKGVAPVAAVLSPPAVSPIPEAFLRSGSRVREAVNYPTDADFLPTERAPCGAPQSADAEAMVQRLLQCATLANPYRNPMLSVSDDVLFFMLGQPSKDGKSASQPKAALPKANARDSSRASDGGSATGSSAVEPKKDAILSTTMTILRRLNEEYRSKIQLMQDRVEDVLAVWQTRHKQNMVMARQEHARNCKKLQEAMDSFQQQLVSIRNSDGGGHSQEIARLEEKMLHKSEGVASQLDSSTKRLISFWKTKYETVCKSFETVQEQLSVAEAKLSEATMLEAQDDATLQSMVFALRERELRNRKLADALRQECEKEAQLSGQRFEDPEISNTQVVASMLPHATIMASAKTARVNSPASLEKPFPDVQLPSAFGRVDDEWNIDNTNLKVVFFTRAGESVAGVRRLACKLGQTKMESERMEKLLEEYDDKMDELSARLESLQSAYAAKAGAVVGPATALFEEAITLRSNIEEAAAKVYELNLSSLSEDARHAKRMADLTEDMERLKCVAAEQAENIRSGLSERDIDNLRIVTKEARGLPVQLDDFSSDAPARNAKSRMELLQSQLAVLDADRHYFVHQLELAQSAAADLTERVDKKYDVKAVR